MELFAFRCGDLVTDACGLLAGRPDGRTMRAPMMAFAVDTGDGVLVFDTGCHEDCCDRAGEYLGPLARAFTPDYGHDATIVARLAQAGYAPDDVRWVSNSHLHFDHAGMNGAFPAATQLVRRRELEHARAQAPKGGFLPGDLAQIAGDDWDYDDTFDLLGDGRLVFVDTAGHTPGHQALQVTFADRASFVLVGDASYTLEGVETATPTGVPWDHDVAVASLERLRDLGATVLTCHDVEQWRDVPDGASIHTA